MICKHETYVIDDIYLICYAHSYQNREDQDIFFEWVKKIKCIKSKDFKRPNARTEFYLDLLNPYISDNDLKEVLALFYRYEMDMKKLRAFLNEDNRVWFFEDKNSYWHEVVWGDSDNREIEN